MAALTCGSSEMDSQSSQDSCSRDGALSPVPSLTGSSASWSSSLSSLPTTPRSSSSHTLSRFASRDSLSLYSPDDKFTQIPMVSPRERRSSSATATARRRKSLASLSIGGGQSTTPTATPSRHLAPPLVPLEGKRLSRKHVEASRRSAKEALEEDLRALDLVGDTQDRSMVDDYALDCYLTSLDYLVKAWRTDTSDVKTRKAIRARLQVLSDSLITPEERADQIQQATTGPPNATSAPSQVDFGQSFFAPFAPLASFLREPAIRFLLLSAALLALQILSAFEVNQFGTDASKACLEHVEQLVSELRPAQRSGACELTERPPLPNSEQLTVFPDTSTCAIIRRPAGLPFDNLPAGGDRDSPSNRARTEARNKQRASLAPSIEADSEDLETVEAETAAN